MPECRRCGVDKPPHKFQRKKRADGTIWVGPTCFVCASKEWRQRQAHPQLPVWPFRWWVRKRAVVYASGPAISTEGWRGRKLLGRPTRRADTPPGLDRLAAHCAGPDVEPSSMERRFNDVLYRAKWVYFDTVDRSLQNEGSTQLWELVEMCEEYVWSNGYSFEQALRRLEDLREWRKWA